MMAKKNSGLSEKDKAAIEKAVRSSVSSAPKTVPLPKARPNRSKVSKMAKGGMCRGGGAATRGKAYNGSY
jgi:hypothetical protein